MTDRQKDLPERYVASIIKRESINVILLFSPPSFVASVALHAKNVNTIEKRDNKTEKRSTRHS